MIPLPPRLYLAIGGAVALSLASFAGGFKVASWRCEARIAEIERAAEKARARNQTKVETQATRFEEERAHVVDQAPKIRTIYRDRVVPGECAVPPDAVGVLNAARDAANARIAGQPEG